MINAEQASTARQLAMKIARATDKVNKAVSHYWQADVDEAKEELAQAKAELDDFLNSITVES